MKGRLVGLLVWLCILGWSQQAAEGEYEVVQITEYIRHGARTTWLNSLNLDFTKELGQGNITANGMRQEFILGEQLRKNYPGIFSNTPVPWDEVEVFASGIGRTTVSAQSHLMGLYPLGIGPNITVDVDSPLLLPPYKGVESPLQSSNALPFTFRPFPINVISPEIDLVFFPNFGETCPDANTYTNKMNRDLHNHHADLVPEFSEELKAAGWDPQALYNQEEFTIDKIAIMYDEMKSYRNYYGKYHDKFGPKIFEKAETLANINFNFLYANEKIKRLFANGVAREMVNGIRSFAQAKSSKKFRLFSGHDTGIYSHMLLYNLTSLNCNLEKWKLGGKEQPDCALTPGYASSFIYELAKQDGIYFVRSLYNGEPIRICDMNQDEYYCRVEDFIRKLEVSLYYNQDDFFDFCGNPYFKNHEEATKSANRTVILLVSLFSGVFLLLLGVFLGLFIWEEKVKEKIRAFRTPKA